MLLKKIRSLKEQLGSGLGGPEVREEELVAEEALDRTRRRRREAEEEEVVERKREVGEELGIQCNLGDSEAIVEAYSGSCSR